MVIFPENIYTLTVGAFFRGMETKQSNPYIYKVWAYIQRFYLELVWLIPALPMESCSLFSSFSSGTLSAERVALLKPLEKRDKEKRCETGQMLWPFNNDFL